MEEATSSLIYRACELARNLESNFPNLANEPDMLSMSIDGIVKTFLAAKETLKFSQHQTPPSSSFAQIQQPQMGATSLMQEWLISSGSYAQPMDQLIQMQQPQPAQMEASPSRLRRRKSEPEKKTVMVPAPQFGNTEVPPEDGFTWRKYGQKEIFGSKYPRSYYRCTHQKLYECPAKKQVQRLDLNPNIFVVTYRGSHTCIMSSTAPSSIPPPQLLVDISPHDMTTQSTTSPQFSSSPTSVSRWLPSAHLGLCSGAATAPAGVDAGSASAGPTTSRHGSSSDYMAADMVDAMFNSGSSSANSTMESLFLFTEDKWELGEEKS